MQRTPRIRRALLAGALLIALSAVPAHAAKPAAPTAKLAYTAKIMITTNVFKLPGKGIKTRLPTHAQWGGGPNVLLVLDTRKLQGQDLAAGRSPGSPEWLQRLDPRGLRPPRARRAGASRSIAIRIS